mmetsp:Transcript_4345/g.18370  ORF Transcript_4345/g.18370 Transcript_4345/m.18370 type:complete len:215 (-) Transcript_4345:2341-2985(-)
MTAMTSAQPGMDTAMKSSFDPAMSQSKALGTTHGPPSGGTGLNTLGHVALVATSARPLARQKGGRKTWKAMLMALGTGLSSGRRPGKLRTKEPKKDTTVVTVVMITIHVCAEAADSKAKDSTYAGPGVLSEKRMKRTATAGRFTAWTRPAMPSTAMAAKPGTSPMPRPSHSQVPAQYACELSPMIACTARTRVSLSLTTAMAWMPGRTAKPMAT